jgi:hypothetical protein
MTANPLGDPLWGYAVFAAIAVFAHEPWRWLGLLLGRNVTVDSAIFLWVRAVSTALVAGLVMRLLLFPAGALAGVGLGLRAAAMGAAIAAFFAAGRSLAAGVGAGAAALALAITVGR